MKLVHEDWHTHIDFVENIINVIYIENPHYYTEILSNLHLQTDGIPGKFVLSEDNSILSFKTKVSIVDSIFTMDFSNRKIMNAIYQELQRVAIEEEYTETAEVKSRVLQYIADLADSLPYDINVGDNLELSGLFKTAELSLENDNDIENRIVDYACLLRDVLKIKLVIFVNLKCFLTTTQLIGIYESLLAKKIDVLLLESRQLPKIEPFENILVIDNDLCELQFSSSQRNDPQPSNAKFEV